MENRYEVTFELYPYQKIADQDSPAKRHSVVIVGGGPVGLALALDLGQRGTPVLLLDDHEGAGTGSRAICFAKRTLEIADRLGAAKPMLDKGVVWNVGKVFYRDDRLFEFNLLPEEGHKHPAFINLQQPYFEKFLVEQIRRAQSAGAPIEIRGKNRVHSLQENDDHISLKVETPDGNYDMNADWLIACDGARSPIREMMGLSFDGRVFEDNFLIADVKMKADFPTERWFWFEPPFKGGGQSALLHKQPDDVWRIDFQLGWNIDREKELDPDNIRTRVDGMLGENVNYDLEWTSIYTFQCMRMEKFKHNRVIFAGDSAHQVSPFGARGANSGVQDAENLAWKLHFVINKFAPESLLDTYSDEREFAADENILNSTRATDFLTPKSEMSSIFRNAVLELASTYKFARPLVNSGRLSVPCTYDDHSLNGVDELHLPLKTRPGAPIQDAPLPNGFLVEQLKGQFTILAIDADTPQIAEGSLEFKLDIIHLRTEIDDPSGLLAERYLGEHAKAIYLVRPDQHVVARWIAPTAQDIMQACKIATGFGGE